MKRKLIILMGIMVLLVSAVSAVVFYISQNNINDSSMDDKSIKVVTSFYPAYVLTINLTDKIPDFKVDSLTDFSAGCLHDYQLTTGDMRLLSNADVFIINGGGMEEYLDEVIDNYPNLKVIDLSMGIDMLKSEGHHGSVNPHVWLDPQLYILQIENARKGIEYYIQENESSIDNYKEVIDRLNSNTRTYLQEVDRLDEDLELILHSVDDMIREKNISNKVVVFHDSFAYISTKAGLEVAYTVEIDKDTPLSAGEVAEVITAIKKDDIRYLFTEEQYDDTISERIREETDAEVYIIDSAVTGDAGKDSYLQAMRRNIDTLKKAFEQPVGSPN